MKKIRIVTNAVSADFKPFMATHEFYGKEKELNRKSCSKRLLEDTESKIQRLLAKRFTKIGCAESNIELMHLRKKKFGFAEGLTDKALIKNSIKLLKEADKLKDKIFLNYLIILLEDDKIINYYYEKKLTDILKRKYFKEFIK